jgi:hypothetical protein
MRQTEEQLLLLVLLLSLPSCSSVFGDAEGTVTPVSAVSYRPVAGPSATAKALAEKHYVFGFSTG